MLHWLTLYLYLIYYALARPKSRVKSCLYYLYYQMIELHYYDYDYYDYDSHPSNSIRLSNSIGHQYRPHQVTSDTHTHFLNHCSIHSHRSPTLKHHLTDSNLHLTNSTTVILLDSSLHCHSPHSRVHVHYVCNVVFYCSSC